MYSLLGADKCYREKLSEGGGVRKPRGWPEEPHCEVEFWGRWGREPFRYLVKECSRQKISKSGNPETKVLGVFWKQPGGQCSLSRDRVRGGWREREMLEPGHAGLCGPPQIESFDFYPKWDGWILDGSQQRRNMILPLLKRSSSSCVQNELEAVKGRSRDTDHEARWWWFGWPLPAKPYIFRVFRWCRGQKEEPCGHSTRPSLSLQAGLP